MITKYKVKYFFAWTNVFLVFQISATKLNTALIDSETTLTKNALFLCHLITVNKLYIYVHGCIISKYNKVYHQNIFFYFFLNQ